MTVQATVAPAPEVALRAKRRALQGLLWLSLFAVSVVILYIFGVTVSNDAGEYALTWDAVQGVSFMEAFRVGRFEIGSLFVFYVFAQFLSSGATFFAVGLLAFSAKAYLLKKYLWYPFAGLCLYVGLFVYAHDANQIRAALAACVILYALLTQHSGKGYLLLAALAGVFHYSGLIIYVLYFARKPLLGLGSLVGLSLVWNQLISSSATLRFAIIFMSNQEGEVHLTSSLFIMQTIISIVCALQWRKLSEMQRRGAYFLMTGVVCYVAFRNNAILAHRLFELSLLGIFPLLLAERHKLTYAFSIIWMGVGYMLVYNIWFIGQKLQSMTGFLS